jgi:hypothetical protein
MALSLSAFTNVKKPANSKNAISLYWFEYDASTGEAGLYLEFGPRSDFTEGNCHLISGIHCRRGYPVSALWDHADPGLGVTNKDLYSDRITKHGP